MERLHMHYLTDLLERVRRGQSDRAIARDLVLSRLTVRKYRELALQHGLADARLPLPDEGTLARLLGPLPPPPRTVSTVAPYAGVKRHEEVPISRQRKSPPGVMVGLVRSAPP